ncbi:MAG: 50S ribosomal protein L11 methyltransferase [Sandaracinaceae bacterium]|nr:50S ribosomal protein L11 methyltransferase [Sandaracinaceae bacterium]
MTSTPDATEAPSVPRYPYVHLDVPTDDVELVSYELWEQGAQGIEERDATTIEHGADASVTTLVVSVPDDAVAAELAAAYPQFNGRVAHVLGDDWRDAWKSYFKPTRVGGRILLRPSWESVEPAPHEVVLTIDPGQAFGSGIHETTRLVLMEVDGRVQPGDTILDVGCGSGILAVAGLLLGAGSAICLDIDPLAVDVAYENAARNGVTERLRASTDDVREVPGQYALVLANIQAWVLKELAAALMERVVPGGVLVLSGVLVGQENDVAESFNAWGVAPALRFENEWVSLTYVRPGDRGAAGGASA